MTANGKRFVNEADGYYQFTTGMINATPDGRTGAGLADLRPHVPAPLPVRHVQAVPGPDLALRAVRLPEAGQDAGRSWPRSAASTRQGLEQTVAEFNRHAAVGEDPEFDRGSTAFNRASGDPEHQPEPVAGAAGEGTVLRDQGAARQLRHLLRAAGRRRIAGCWTPTGEPIPGLYVAGSDQANVMGGHYPSGGINIGPAMTFGYIAGRHVAGVTDYENVVPNLQNDGV